MLYRQDCKSFRCRSARLALEERPNGQVRQVSQLSAAVGGESRPLSQQPQFGGIQVHWLHFCGCRVDCRVLDLRPYVLNASRVDQAFIVMQVWLS